MRPQLNPAPMDAESEVSYLREQVRELERQIRIERESSSKAMLEVRNEVAMERRAYTKLRRSLQPWKELIDTIFGELDAAGVESDVAQSSTQRPHVSAAWDKWKQTFPGKTAAIIDTLLAGGKMNRDQLRIATQSGWSTLDAGLKKLKDVGLLLKEGNYYYLKPL